MSNSLNSLQRDFLAEWFKQTPAYFLTGGAALVLGLGIPRITKDLDLFTVSEEAFDEAAATVRTVADAVGADCQSLRKSPSFQRYKLSRADEETLLDVVLDPVPQLYPEKVRWEDLLLDRAEEILVNKVCAIVGRGEGRDFVDAYFLTTQGYDLQQALEQAQAKDGGVNETTMLYVLSDVNWDRYQVPGVDPQLVANTAQFFGSWRDQLARRVFPAP